MVLNKAGRDLKRDKKLPPSEHWIERGLAVPVESQVRAMRTTTTEGLTAPWVDATFINPPFNVLKLWLLKSLEETCDHVMLVPVRTHRPWWRDWAIASEVVYLDPVKFEGHDQSFPAPLCLARRNAPKRGELIRACEILGLGCPI
jgi:hypothetical protein